MCMYFPTFANKKSLRKSGVNEPVQMAAIMMLFILGVVMFPTRKIVGWFYSGDDEFVFLLADGIQRLIFSAVMFKFIADFGFNVIPEKMRVAGFFAVLPAVIIAINNFPFVSFLSGNCSVTETPGNIAIFAVWCLGVGLFEEVSFRGVVLPLIYVKLRESNLTVFGKKKPVFLTVAISSAIFALTHLVNLFNGFNPAVFLQVGYTFLIGSMCGIVFVKTGNILFPSAMHFIYNFGGMLVEKCGVGTIWTTEQIICTAVVGVIVGAYLVYVVLFTADKDCDVLEYAIYAEDIESWKTKQNAE